MNEKLDGEDAASGTAAGDAAPWVALNAASHAKADAYLDEQISFIRVQKEHLHEQRLLLLSHLKWRRFDDQLQGALKIMLVLVGAAVVLALGAAVWNAREANGLIVDSFSVPPAFAQSGVTGEVVADDITTRLADIRDRGVRNSFSNSADVSKGGENAIRVEIPDTGISIAEAWRSLRDWLGHERHLTGSLRDAGNGAITLTLSMDGESPVAVSGPAIALPKLEQEAAERVFERFDPVNHIVYLLSQSRYVEANDAATRFLSTAQGRLFQADSYALFGETTRLATGDLRAGVAHERIGMMIDPTLATPHLTASRDLTTLGHYEESLHEAQTILTLKDSEQLPSHRGTGFAGMQGEAKMAVAMLVGDFEDAASEDCGHGCANLGSRILTDASYRARAHDGAIVRRMLAQAVATGSAKLPISATVRPQAAEARYWIDADAEDWVAALNDAKIAREDTMQPDGDISARFLNAVVSVRYDPLIAVASAHLGDFAAAHRVIDATPGDCYPCNDARGVIDGLQGNRAGADYWFARAVHDAPSIPFAHADRGAMLLRDGRYGAAIAEFKLANDKGPHFADPLEMWGEALMLQNRSDLALAKFGEADQYAPNWGRLHLKWGEALFYAGRSDESKKQIALAATLDLSAADRADLSHWMTSHG